MVRWTPGPEWVKIGRKSLALGSLFHTFLAKEAFMAARNGAVLAILCFALIVTPWSGGWAQEDPVSPKAPDIRVSPESLDFGSLKAGEKTKGTLTISNPGTADLEVTLSGLERVDFVIAGPTSFLLEPTRTRRVRIFCVALEGSSGSSPLDTVQATLRIEHNVPNREAVLVFLTYRFEPVPEGAIGLTMNRTYQFSYEDGQCGPQSPCFRLSYSEEGTIAFSRNGDEIVCRASLVGGGCGTSNLSMDYVVWDREGRSCTVTGTYPRYWWVEGEVVSKKVALEVTRLGDGEGMFTTCCPPDTCDTSNDPPEAISSFDEGAEELQMPFRNGAKWRTKQRRSCDGGGCSSYDFQWTLRN